VRGGKVVLTHLARRGAGILRATAGRDEQFIPKQQLDQKGHKERLKSERKEGNKGKDGHRAREKIARALNKRNSTPWGMLT